MRVNDECLNKESKELEAWCSVKRAGQDPETREFSRADAERAGLWNKDGTWKKYPKRMLQMRARGWSLRDVFADVLCGLSIREEVRDYNIADQSPIAEPEEIVDVTEPSNNGETSTTKTPEATNNGTDPANNGEEATTQEVIDEETGEVIPAEVLSNEPLPTPDELFSDKEMSGGMGGSVD